MWQHTRFFLSLFPEIASCDNPINCLSEQTRHLIGCPSRWRLIKLRSKSHFALTFALVDTIDTFRQQPISATGLCLLRKAAETSPGLQFQSPVSEACRFEISRRLSTDLGFAQINSEWSTQILPFQCRPAISLESRAKTPRSLNCHRITALLWPCRYLTHCMTTI